MCSPVCGVLCTSVEVYKHLGGGGYFFSGAVLEKSSSIGNQLPPSSK